MSATIQVIGQAIQELLDAGFEPDGLTREQTVRIPTRNSPLFGKLGGELAQFGGRRRFRLPDSTVKATVGARTTALYHSEGGGLSGVRGIATIATSDLSSLRSVLEQVKPQE
jgi:hypothetical protein